MRINIEHYKTRTEAILAEESTLDEVLPAIIGALVAVGWSYEVVIRYLVEWARAKEQEQEP
jgi:hypothetical protein